jgi:uncharacterized repeat protein (TIGR02543 family)
LRIYCTYSANRREGYTFNSWEVISGDVTLDDINSAATTFILPSENVIVTANWDEVPQPVAWSLVNLILCGIGALIALLVLFQAFIQNSRKTRWIWLFLTLIAGIAGVAVFFCTENIQNSMGYVDNWTAVNAVILVIGIISAILSFKKLNNA